MHDQIKMSVVIPTYNRELTIKRAIDSVLEQSYAPAEIIVIDDGSEDSTSQAIKHYGHQIRYIYQENTGVAAARNKGVAEAKEEWIAFLDSDDYWFPHHLHNMARAISATGGQASLYFSDANRYEDNGEKSHWEACGFQISTPYLLKNDASEWVFMNSQPMMTPTCVIRRESYIEIGAIPLNMPTREDTLLFYKLALGYPVCAVSGCGAMITSDGARRMTKLFSSDSRVYLQSTIFLFKALCSDKGKLKQYYQRRIIESLSLSYISLGRYFFRQMQYPLALKNYLIALWISPFSFWKKLNDSLRKKLF